MIQILQKLKPKSYSKSSSFPKTTYLIAGEQYMILYNDVRKVKQFFNGQIGKLKVINKNSLVMETKLKNEIKIPLFYEDIIIHVTQALKLFYESYQ